MIDFLIESELPFAIVFTKADKLSKQNIKPSLMRIASVLKVGINDITPTSAEKNVGKEEVLSLIDSFINK